MTSVTCCLKRCVHCGHNTRQPLINSWASFCHDPGSEHLVHNATVDAAKNAGQIPESPVAEIICAANYSNLPAPQEDRFSLPVNEVSQKPVTRKSRHLLQRTRFFKQVGCTLDNLYTARSFQGGFSQAIQLDNLQIQATHNQQGR